MASTSLLVVVEVRMSHLGSRRFRQVLAICFFGAFVGDAIALALLAGRTSNPAVWLPLVALLPLFVVAIAACVDSLDEPGPEEEEGDDGDDFRERGRDDPLRPPDGSGGEPAWWPRFEADFRAYLAERHEPTKVSAKSTPPRMR